MTTFDKNIEIYTDGACKVHKKLGGYGIVIKDFNNRKITEISGGSIKTTNNRMELTAVIRSLQYLKQQYGIENYKKLNISVCSYSLYVINSRTKKWYVNWRRCDWKKQGKDIINVDLWKIINDLLNEKNDIYFYWIRGHNGHQENERCDYLATSYIDNKLQ